MPTDTSVSASPRAGLSLVLKEKSIFAEPDPSTTKNISPPLLVNLAEMPPDLVGTAAPCWKENLPPGF